MQSRLDGPLLFSYYQQGWRPDSAAQIAARIRELSARRKLAAVASRVVQKLDTAWAHAEDAAVQPIVAEFRAACDEIERCAVDKTMPVPLGMGEFLEEPDTHDWLIPGLLERSERIVLTGSEGLGKTVLCSQLATCMAGGVHPFTAHPLGSGVRGIRVLVVDCENSAAQSRRRFRRMVGVVDHSRRTRGLSPMDWSESMFIEIRPAGIDLLSGRDVAWLEHAISATAPDLLVLGPLYKLHHTNPSDETSARELVWVLDGLRERYGFALLTEAHAGNASDVNGDRLMRPIGSSLFRRWPEFGFGLRKSPTQGAPEVDVVSWRGSREERDWPEQLVRAETLPWMPVGGDGYGRLGAVS